MIHKDQLDSAADEHAAELLSSDAADLTADNAADDAQPESDLTGVHPSKPEGQSTEQPVHEKLRGSDESNDDV